MKTATPVSVLHSVFLIGNNAIRYVTNQKDRMQYAEYRQLGLPITSAYIESTIKQVDRRVKGSVKFWSVNANPMLQLRADAISQTQAVTKILECEKAKPCDVYPLQHGWIIQTATYTPVQATL